MRMQYAGLQGEGRGPPYLSSVSNEQLLTWMNESQLAVVAMQGKLEVHLGGMKDSGSALFQVMTLRRESLRSAVICVITPCL